MANSNWSIRRRGNRVSRECAEAYQLAGRLLISNEKLTKKQEVAILDALSNATDVIEKLMDRLE